MIRLSDTVTLYHADCRDALRSLPDNSVDSVPCDPPYALTSASRNGSPRNNDPETPYGRTKLGERGFMGKTWDTGEIVFDASFWAEVFRVLKPGGHVAAFSASRTYHRMACAIEDAGFEIRDSLMWIYGTGFPKSLDVSKAIDKAAGAEREVIGQVKRTGKEHGTYGAMAGDNLITAPATDLAAEWEGWGTALKPAFEPIVLARKPLSEGTVAANVLRWRTGALNIGASRISSPGETITNHARSGDAEVLFGAHKAQETHQSAGQAAGRWPANVVHDGSDEVVGMFPVTSSGVKRGGQYGRESGVHEGGQRMDGTSCFGDSGSAARFFYSAKASKADRNGSKHPTVKPISLMEWLCTLITPPGGTVLDPFAGSGTTGIAATRKGFRAILCEREAEYVADIRARFGTRPALVLDLDRIRADMALQPLVTSLRARFAARG